MGRLGREFFERDETRRENWFSIRISNSPGRKLFGEEEFVFGTAREINTKSESCLFVSGEIGFVYVYVCVAIYREKELSIAILCKLNNYSAKG